MDLTIKYHLKECLHRKLYEMYVRIAVVRLY